MKTCSVLLVACLAITVNSAAVSPGSPNNTAASERDAKQVPVALAPVPFAPPPTTIVEDLIAFVCSILKGILQCPCDGGKPPTGIAGFLCTLLDKTICPGCPKTLPIDLGLSGFFQSFLPILQELLKGIPGVPGAPGAPGVPGGLPNQQGLEKAIKELNDLLEKLIDFLKNTLPNPSTQLPTTVVTCPTPIYQ